MTDFGKLRIHFAQPPKQFETQLHLVGPSELDKQRINIIATEHKLIQREPNGESLGKGHENVRYTAVPPDSIGIPRFIEALKQVDWIDFVV